MNRILKDVFNVCITFPKSWGLGEITPIPKVNIHSKKPEEWRPITQIKLPGKLLERCVHTQLYSYFDQNFSQQHGFRPQSSTSTAVFDMLKTSFASWNNKLYQTCIFIDFSKAFDCIDHKILISKLKLYGLDRNSIAFISSYFESRHQRTCVDGIFSDISKVTYGTNQGSIIGPLIFIIYVNDIFNLLNEKNEVIMYADGTLIMCEGSTILESNSRCQTKLDSLIQWCDKNKLSVNIKKTKCMHINSFDESTDVRLYIRGKPIEIVKHFEYLGMIIDNKLQMYKHADNVYKKARQKLGMLYKIRKFITLNTALLLYKVMIRPHVEYGDFLIDSSTQKCIDRIERLQERTVRVIEYEHLPNKRKEMSKLKSSLGIEDLAVRRKRSLLRLMYSLSKQPTNVEIATISMSLRSSKKLKLKSDFTRLTKIQRSPYYRGLYLWNSLPEKLQKETNRLKFKMNVKLLFR